MTGGRKILARGVWVFELSIVVAIVALTALNRSTSQGADWVFNLILAAVGLAYVTVGAIVGARRGNTLGWMLCVLGIGFTLGNLSDQYALYATVTDPGSLPVPAAAAAMQSVFGLGAAMIGPIFLLFPNGKVPGPRWGPLLWLAPGAAIVASVAFALRPGPLNGTFSNYGVDLINPIGIPGARGAIEVIVGALSLVSVAAGIGCAISIVVRFRRSIGEERQQIRWLAYVGGAALLFFVMLLLGGFVFGDEATVNDLLWLGFVLTLGFGIPAACGIAILRYRLYDLDVVVKKTVVFGIVVVTVVVLYLLLAVAVPLALAGEGGAFDVTPILLGIAIGLAVIPVRNRARRLADRVVYGRRASPYEVLSEFSDRLAETYSTDDVLPRMVQLLAGSTGAREVRVWLRVGDELIPVESWPADAGRETPRRTPGEGLPPFDGVESYPVRHQGELLGALTLAMPANDPMDPSKEKLVHDLASQAGLVLRNVRLIEDLRASRRRIVAAQDERAKALERNIHDGAQQQLVALTVKLRLAEQLVAKDTARAGAMIAQLQAEATDALENLRDLARGIYPPLLADKGLATALEAQARKSPVPVTVEADDVGRYAPEIEAALYFCTLEALNNVAKYARASRATVRLNHDDGRLAFEVTDDGCGFDPKVVEAGTGLQGMHDRLEALGGSLEVRSTPGEGTAVVGHVPGPASG